jgi:hypothetical protein
VYALGGEGRRLLDGLIEAPPDAPPQDAAAGHGVSAFDDLIVEGPRWRVSAAAGVPKIIPGVLAASGVGIIAGEPKVGKTWLVVDLALSVANGCALLGQYPVSAAGRVLYVATEGSHDAMRGRFDGLARGKGLDPEKALDSIDFIWRALIVLDDRFTEWLTTKASMYSLVIVDVLRDAWTGDENDNSAVAELMRRLKTVTSCGTTIVLVHHYGKSTQDTAHRRPGQRLRGASTFHAALDSGIFLERGKNSTRTQVAFEAKDDVEEARCSFAWPETKVDGEAPVTLDWRPGEDTVTRASEMVVAVVDAVETDPGLSRTSIVKKLRARQQVAIEAIDLALRQRLIEERPTPYLQVDGRKRVRRGLYVVDTPSHPLASADTASGRPSEPGTPSRHGDHEQDETPLFEFE